MKGKLFLMHWNKSEVEDLARPLRDQGWQVDCEWEDGARAGKKIQADPPDVIVIHLTRLPSHGRATAGGLKGLKATRHLPIIFVDGKDEPLAKTKAQVPDATYTTSARLAEVLKRFARTSSRARSATRE